MKDFFIHILDEPILISIPFVSAFVGWITNLLAIKMTFYPIEFKGLRPFGWQGIIPSKARKMAETAVDLWNSKLINIEEEFARVEPAKVAREMTPSIDRLSRQIIDEVMDAQAPKIWQKTPNVIKESIYQEVSNELPAIVREIMNDVKANFKNLLDLKELAVTALTQNKQLLNQVFLNCGKQEFRFIEHSGFYFGFAFGIIQMVVWHFFPLWWILPIAGLLVGYFTNYFALKLIFRPLHPLIIGKLVIQGMFIKRQQEVSLEYSNIVASKIITVENIFEYIIRGPGAENMYGIVQKHIQRTIEHTAGAAKEIIETVSSTRMFEYIRNIASFRFMQELPQNIRTVFGYTEEALNLKEVLFKKMKMLSPVEFEAFLRPVFKEDEMTLILVGATLGGIAGLLQYFLVFY